MMVDLEFDPENVVRYQPWKDAGISDRVVRFEDYEKLLVLYNQVRSLTDEKIQAECEKAARAVLGPLVAESAMEASKED
jgi:hypothetical protein